MKAFLYLLLAMAINSKGLWYCDYTVISNYTSTNVPAIVMTVTNPINVTLNSGFGLGAGYTKTNSAIIITNPCGSTPCPVGKNYNVSFFLGYDDATLICYPFNLSQTGASLVNGNYIPIPGCVMRNIWAGGMYLKASIVIGLIALFIL